MNNLGIVSLCEYNPKNYYINFPRTHFFVYSQSPGHTLRVLPGYASQARLIKKVYGEDPPVCPECGSEMKILAVLFDRDEISKILTHPVKIGRAPPKFDPASLN